jgi:DNA-binding transcriptional LysR family regulator
MTASHPKSPGSQGGNGNPDAIRSKSHALTPEALVMMDTIARTGSFAAAARDLGKVPSALTYNVRQLEDALDVLLFDRSSGQAKLTSAGEELLHHGRRLLNDMDAVANRVRRVAGGWESQLSIAVDDVIDHTTMLELVESFYSVTLEDGRPHGTHLKWRTEVLSGTLDALVSGEADLGLGVMHDNATYGQTLSVSALGEMEFVFVVAPHHPLAAAPAPLTDADVAMHRAIAVADTSRRVAPLTLNLLEGQDVLTVASMQVKVQSLVKGLGCGFVPIAHVQRLLDAKQLVRKDVTRPPIKVKLGYGWRTLAAPQPKKPPQGLALAWWLKQLESPSTRAALISRAHAHTLA